MAGTSLFFQNNTPSEPCFFLMSHGQDDQVARIEPVTRHVATVTKIDDPVTELIIHIWDRPSHGRLQRQHIDTITYGRDRSFGCVLVFRS